MPDRVQAIRQYPRPTNLRSLCRFLGIVGFYARFIPGYSEVAAVLYGLKKETVPFVWAEEHQGAFEKLKRVLCEARVLQVPDFTREFVFTTESSVVAVSAILQQKIDGALTPISYNRILADAERKIHTYEKECLAVLFCCEKCRAYLEHRIQLYCDNLALSWLLKRSKTLVVWVG
jgi:hypothetical protein